ncbi:MAG: hypothetical protein KDA92_13090 [Planctomycetales bacterium]|nr:hypothetical protein [Planctomycetales bacterium]
MIRTRVQTVLALSACLLPSLLIGTLAAQSSNLNTDLLKLRPLAARIAADNVARQTNPSWANGAFLTPMADDIDALAVGEFTARPLAMQWLSQHSTSMTLIRREDWQALEQRLANLPDAAIDRWWTESAALRELLDDEAWQATDTWLQEFLEVQAIYSADELNRFRRSLVNLTADELFDVTMHFVQVHEERQRRNALSQQMRLDALRANREMRASPSAARTASLYAGQTYSPTSTYPARSPRQPGYAARTSLSQRVSQVYIYRSLWGGNNFIWWGW